MAIVSLMWIKAFLFFMMSHGGFAWVPHHHHHVLDNAVVRKSSLANGDLTLIHHDNLLNQPVPYPTAASTTTTTPVVSLEPTDEPYSLPTLQKKHFSVPQWAKRLWLRRWRPWLPRVLPDAPKTASEPLFTNVPSPVSVGHWLFCCMKEHPEVCVVHIMLLLGAAEVVAGMGLGPFREEVA